ncbi:hypothetical protein [Helicobacter cetorum]|uniref:hypothetical protein n=1 Tax=Helicobacter cetorum TaxID=138563 RepID=UPI000CF1503A|nr:hypothetical protein [Helicobacter cetorum]
MLDCFVKKFTHYLEEQAKSLEQKGVIAKTDLDELFARLQTIREYHAKKKELIMELLELIFKKAHIESIEGLVNGLYFFGLDENLKIIKKTCIDGDLQQLLSKLLYEIATPLICSKEELEVFIQKAETLEEEFAKLDAKHRGHAKLKAIMGVSRIGESLREVYQSNLDYERNRYE